MEPNKMKLWQMMFLLICVVNISDEPAKLFVFWEANLFLSILGCLSRKEHCSINPSHKTNSDFAPETRGKMYIQNPKNPWD